MRYSLASLCLTLIIASCAISSSSTQTNEIPAANSENTIVFVVFKIRKGPTKSTVEVVSNTKSTGKMKRQTENTLDSNNAMTIEILKDNKIFQTITMNHPLFKSFEFVATDGKLGRKDVALKEDTFFIRFQTKGEATSIKIRETLSGTVSQEIANFKL
jgi:hypothetical protein